MMRQFFFVFFLFYGLNLSAQNNCSISGVVQDDHSHEVMPSVLVKVLDAHLQYTGKACLSDIDGKFKLYALNPGKYTLMFYYIGYENDTLNVELKSGGIKWMTVYMGLLTDNAFPLVEPNTLPAGRVTREEFEKMKNDTAYGCIKGILTDSKADEAIPFCNVTLYNSHFVKDTVHTTDFDGNFKFTKLSEGKYFLVFKYIGFYTDTAFVELAKGETKNISVKIEEATDYLDAHDPIAYQEPLVEPNTLPAGTVTREEFMNGNLAGKIVNSKYPDEGIPFAKVICVHHENDFQTTTDFDGKYIIRGLPPGKYLIEIQLYNCGEKIIPVYIEAGRTDSLNVSLCCSDVVLEELSPMPVGESSVHVVPPTGKNDSSLNTNDSLLQNIYAVSHAHRRGNFDNYDFLKHSVLKQFDDSTFYFDYNEFGCRSSVLYLKKGSKFYREKNSGTNGPAEFGIRNKKNFLKIKCKGASAKLISTGQIPQKVPVPYRH